MTRTITSVITLNSSRSSGVDILSQDTTFMQREFGRFLLVGATNTLISYALYLLLILLTPYLVAYSLSYCMGVVLSYFLNVRFVFRRQVSLASFLKFPLVYVIQYAVGAVTLWALVGKAEVAPGVAMIGVIATTIPVTYVASRYVIAKNTNDV